MAAARFCFAEEGYERASLRGIARRAGVDPALVHHYFDGKPELFMAVMQIGRDPAAIFDQVQASPNKGAALIRAFLDEWEPRPGDSGPSPFVTIVQAVCSSPGAGRALREFLGERVWARLRSGAEAGGTNLGSALVTSQLWGVALARHVLRIEPLASATLDQIAEWYGPILERLFEAPLPIVPIVPVVTPNGALGVE